MTSSRVIEILAAEAAFNPGTLEAKFPERVLGECGSEARYFFNVLEDAPKLNALSLLDGRWRKDPIALRAYEKAGPEGRLEIHAIICAMLHERIHRVDLLITPFGVQYLMLMVEEYRLLQRYIPQALDRHETLNALCVLKNLSDGLPPAVAEDKDLAELWSELSVAVRRVLAWGDLSTSRPPQTEIAPGWFDGDLNRPLDHFGTGGTVERITVCGVVRSFRPAGTTGWYVRPLTIFEAKALASTMLFVLDISGDNIDDLRRYFAACYGGNSDKLQPDYLYIFDVVAQILGRRSFSDALALGSAVLVRSLLLLVMSLCWFALHAPPVLRDRQEISPAATSVTMRLFAALSELKEAIKPQLSSGSEFCSRIENTDFFKSLQQARIEDALTETNRALDALKNQVKDIWNPDVRARFLHLIGIMQPYFEGREPRYDSLMGMPNDGNVVLGARSDAEYEALYDDHLPTGDAAEWLTLRRTLLFSYGQPRLNDKFVERLDKHFLAVLLWWFCPHCDSLTHSVWASRFEQRYRVMCPETGKFTDVGPENTQSIRF